VACLDALMTATHDELVRDIVAQVRARPAERKLTIGKNHPGHTPHDLGYKQGCHAVRVDALDRILQIDREQRLAVVEGQVQLGALCQAAFAVGLMPKVVPEFETFTISGLINGLGIETTSHRHGVFPASAVALEVVLGNGDVIEATRAAHGDVLRNLPGSYGTLGIVTRATLELVPARPFIRSRYRHFARLTDYAAAFRQALGEHEFVEGFVLGRDSYVLVTGAYSEHVAGLDVFAAMTPGLPWYYQHATERAQKDEEDLVPAYQYMFRHQRGLLWLAGIIADLKVFSHTRWGRALVDREVERKVRSNGFKWNMPAELVERSLVNQDMGMRLSRLEEGIEYVQRHLGVYPLWNCPAGQGTVDPAFAIPSRLAERLEMVVDIGIYGEPTVRPYHSYEAMRALQKFVDVPSLWGVCYLSPEELREIYDFASFRRVQEANHAAEAFLPLESKLQFMRPAGAAKGPVPLWRLVNLYYDWRAKRA
jgi:delta24-sterol reductase